VVALWLTLPPGTRCHGIEPCVGSWPDSGCNGETLLIIRTATSSLRGRKIRLSTGVLCVVHVRGGLVVIRIFA